MGTTQELFDAIASGDTAMDTVTTLLASSPTLASAPNEQGLSPLMFALYYRRSDLAELIIAAGAELNIFEIAALGQLEKLTPRIKQNPEAIAHRSPDGFTLLHFACFFGHVACAKLLIERGAEVNIAADNESRVYPIHSAAACNSAEIVILLLESGAEADARQHKDYTSLMSAAMHNNLPMAKALLAAGANPSQESEDDRTPISLAQEAGHGEMVEELKKAIGNGQ